jgi:anhydro-N-acetylmuramic acid kinase
MNILGIMSGTSADGVDYVWTKVSVGEKLEIEFVHQEHKKIPAKIKKNIELAITNKLGTYDLALLNYEVGRMYADHFLSFKKLKLETDFIGLHGQTVFHEGGIATLQIGEPTFLSVAAKAPVIFNFRAGDVALGGEGAPLAPIFHKAIVGSPETPTGFHNLGGISNITYIEDNYVQAFDTGPANTLMDIWIHHKSKGKKAFDKNGAHAKQGVPHVDTLKKLLKTSFLLKLPPKSTGRELYNLSFIKKNVPPAFLKLSLEDQLATLTEFSVLSICDAYKRFLPKMPKQIYFSGGGTKNPYLMKRLRIALSGVDVKTSTELGWPESAIEGGTFALLAFLRVQEQKIQLTHITGNKSLALLGQICGE